jgi:hypothetical protein
MYAANTFRIRPATGSDAHVLRHLADLDSRDDLRGRILIGEIDERAAAAISIDNGAVVANPFIHTAALVSTLRRRADGLRAVERTPSLRERMLAAIPARLRARTGDAGA